MPRFAINDYVFYKIINEDLPDYIYIGSTCCFLKRKYSHKNACNNPNHKRNHLKIYQTIIANGGWDKWNMVIISKLDQSTLIGARIHEEELRIKYSGNLNMVKAHTTTEERIAYDKEYNQLNKLEIKERTKKYRENNQLEIKEKNKIYHQNNKLELNEKKKANYEKNKETLKEKHNCECGVIVRKSDLPRHKRSQAHQKYCETIDLNSK